MRTVVHFSDESRASSFFYHPPFDHPFIDIITLIIIIITTMMMMLHVDDDNNDDDVVCLAACKQVEALPASPDILSPTQLKIFPPLREGKYFLP